MLRITAMAILRPHVRSTGHGRARSYQARDLSYLACPDGQGRQAGESVHPLGATIMTVTLVGLVYAPLALAGAGLGIL